MTAPLRSGGQGDLAEQRAQSSVDLPVPFGPTITTRSP